MDDETMLQRMGRLNPWWRTGAVPAGLLKEFKRRGYSAMARHLAEPPAQSILGARQVGKTTMLYQLIAGMLSSGADPRRILLLTLDGPGIAYNTGGLLRLLELYAAGVICEPLSGLTKGVHAFIDEAHHVSGWRGVVKQFIDRGWPVKFVVTASSASGALAGPPEPPQCGMRHQTLAAMSFAEYAAFKDSSYSEPLASAGRRMRAGLAESARAGSASPFYESVKRASLGLATSRDGLLARLAEYMQHGGYPGVAALGDPLEKHEAIRMHLGLSLYKDAARAGRVRNLALLDQLFHVYAWRSPNMISDDRASRNLGVSRGTVGAHGEALRRAFLVSYADFYAERPTLRHRRNRKVYVNDVGVRNVASMLADTDPIDNPAEVGMMAETVAADHTRRLWQSLAPESAAPMPHFWYARCGLGVDLVIKLHQRPVPIQVEYRRHVEASDLKGLSRFSARFDPPVAVALTRDGTSLIGDRIVAVPMWLYLCMC